MKRRRPCSLTIAGLGGLAYSPAAICRASFSSASRSSAGLWPGGSSEARRTEMPKLSQAQQVELSGGHCAILEHADEVNRRLRMLTESVTLRQATS